MNNLENGWQETIRQETVRQETIRQETIRLIEPGGIAGEVRQIDDLAQGKAKPGSEEV